MNKQLFLAVSVIALTAATSVIAAPNNANPTIPEKVQNHATDTNETRNPNQRSTQEPNSMERGWDKTKRAVSDTANDISNGASKAYKDIKASLIDDDAKTKISTVNINTRNTASGMIGKTIYNAKNEGIGKVHDIILDANGKPVMVIVADGEIFGLGKQVAFDYSVVTKQNKDGDIIAPLDEKTIEQAAEFSYDRNGTDNNVRVIPANGYSVNELLDAELVDQNNESVADVDDISFRNGQASQIIVGFDKTLGMGGNKAALAFTDAQIVRKGENDYDFKLSANQAAQFEAYKKSVN